MTDKSGAGASFPGLLAALTYGGYEPLRAALLAARANRLAGRRAGATPATRVKEIIDCFPTVFREDLSPEFSNKGGL